MDIESIFTKEFEKSTLPPGFPPNSPESQSGVMSPSASKRSPMSLPTVVPPNSSELEEVESWSSLPGSSAGVCVSHQSGHVDLDFASPRESSSGLNLSRRSSVSPKKIPSDVNNLLLHRLINQPLYVLLPYDLPSQSPGRSQARASILLKSQGRSRRSRLYLLGLKNPEIKIIWKKKMQKKQFLWIAERLKNTNLILQC